MIRLLLVLAVIGTSVPAIAGTGDAGAGKSAFSARCGACHSLTPGQNRSGPSLAGIVGRKAGSVEGFRYSTALKNSGMTFDAASLSTFLENPRKAVPGTIMLISVPDSKMREDIIAYLATGGS